MSVVDDEKSFEQKKKRRFLSPEKKFQIFLESQTGKRPVGEILRREGIYSTEALPYWTKRKNRVLS